MANEQAINGTSAPKAFKVGIICGSQRNPRAGPQITDFVFQTISSHLAATTADTTSSAPVSNIAFDHIDVASLGLPLFDEPVVPSRVFSPEGYAHEHTRAWSRRIAGLDAFVFVTPQYNWGIPAGLKNAVDYLFNEWKGKPAMVVSYGGHGGDKCAAALKVVLGGGIDMRVVERTVNLRFPDRGFLVSAATGKDLGLRKAEGSAVWAEQKAEITAVWDEMVAMLAA